MTIQVDNTLRISLIFYLIFILNLNFQYLKFDFDYNLIN